MVSAENQHVFCEICAKIQRNFKKVVFEYKKDGKFVFCQSWDARAAFNGGVKGSAECERVHLWRCKGQSRACSRGGCMGTGFWQRGGDECTGCQRACLNVGKCFGYQNCSIKDVALVFFFDFYKRSRTALPRTHFQTRYFGKLFWNIAVFSKKNYQKDLDDRWFLVTNPFEMAEKPAFLLKIQWWIAFFGIGGRGMLCLQMRWMEAKTENRIQTILII